MNMTNDRLHIFDCESCRALNASLAKLISTLPEERFKQRSHFFHGRYENLYLDAKILPGLEQILGQALQRAAVILDRSPATLRLGFWLNIMQRGDVTTLHSHDDDDELLSAVYYLQVPENSGLFRLHHKGRVQEILPVEGRFMFFDPAMPHEVTEHQDDLARISIGINIGPAG